MAQLKAAVIGAGWFACECHIPALASRDEVILDGVCRVGKAELERAKDHFGFAFASEDYAKVLERKPDIVVVSSPHKFHFEHAMLALESGAHVLCEKPMTLDPRHAWQLVRRAQALEQHLLIANTYHYLPHVAHLRDRIASGLVGEIEHVTCSFISATRDVFSGSRGLDRWKEALFKPDESTWRDAASGGGFTYGQMSHSVALMYFLTGLNPVSVSSSTYCQGSVDIATAAQLKLDNGAVAAVSGAAAMPQGHRAQMRISIAGSLGLVTAEFDADRCVIMLNDGMVENLPLKSGDWALDNTAPVKALVDLACGKGQNLSNGSIGAQTVATIAAIVDSANQRGATVSVQK